MRSFLIACLAWIANRKVFLQIESKISARRLSDFHPNFGQVISSTHRIKASLYAKYFHVVVTI